jgi:two-component system cell cycle response regulator CpdR
MNTSTPGGPAERTGRRVLLVEDNDAASRGLARLLEAWGFDVTITRDGYSALRALDTQPPPHFILTDLQLPDLDGREIARHAQSLDPAPRVALITGWDIDDALEDLQACGIQWIFPKPLDTFSLISRLRDAPDPAGGDLERPQ